MIIHEKMLMLYVEQIQAQVFSRPASGILVFYVQQIHPNPVLDEQASGIINHYAEHIFQKASIRRTSQ